MKFLLAVLLQLIGGSIFGVGLFCGSDSARIQRSAELVSKRSKQILNRHAYEALEAGQFSTLAIAIVFIVHLFYLLFLFGVVYSAQRFLPISDSIAKILIVALVAFYLIASTHDAKSFDDLVYWLILPLGILPPLIFLTTVLVSLLVRLPMSWQIGGSAMLLLAVHITYLLPPLIALSLSKETRVSLLVCGTMMYGIGTWIVGA